MDWMVRWGGKVDEFGMGCEEGKEVGGGEGKRTDRRKIKIKDCVIVPVSTSESNEARERWVPSNP